MQQQLEDLFQALWHDYRRITPSADKIHALLGQTQQGAIINDHIALRTFNDPRVNIDTLAQVFLQLGYQAGGEYEFPQKKLFARHYEHPDAAAPKVFISELLLEQCSEFLQLTAQCLLSQLDEERVQQPGFLYSGCHWELDYSTYEQLLDESEYAAWLAAWGFRANHFTVSINHLQHFQSLAEVNQLLKDHGFSLNSAGGEIKGTPADYLEQSAIMADRVERQFADQSAVIPSCYYEFARRYPLADGHLYSGFVAASADKIFESTHSR